MKLLMCSIFDAAIGIYSAPFYARSKGEASRNFSDAVNDAKTDYCKHPSDFTLFAVGVFDDKDATIEQQSQPTKIITALECKALPENLTQQ